MERAKIEIVEIWRGKRQGGLGEYALPLLWELLLVSFKSCVHSDSHHALRGKRGEILSLQHKDSSQPVFSLTIRRKRVDFGRPIWTHTCLAASLLR